MALSTNSCFLILLPLGKPDPTIPRSLDGQDCRARIKQEAQKDNTCWYYLT